MLIVGATVLAAAYKWVDEDGVVHYSDRPHQGAEEIVLPTHRHGSSRPPPVRAAQQNGFRERQGAAPAEPPPPFTYESLAVVSPAAEETLWNIEGILNVTLEILPALQPGHTVRVYFDGTPQQVNGASFQIPEVYLGVHNLQVEILDETGQLMIRSRANRFYVQQNAIAQGK